MLWTMQTIAELRELWTQGHSASEIGHQMHTTKNSIVGKAHRLGLEARPSPIKPSGEPRPYPVRRLMPSSRTLPGLPSEATTCRYQGDWITEERKAVIKRDWPTYKHRAHILAELAQLPGPMWPSPEAVTSYVSSLGLHKPYDYRSPRRNAAPVVAKAPVKWMRVYQPVVRVDNSRVRLVAPGTHKVPDGGYKLGQGRVG